MKPRGETIAGTLPALAALFALSASTTAIAAKLRTSPCELPGVARPAQCGVLDILEDSNQHMAHVDG